MRLARPAARLIRQAEVLHALLALGYSEKEALTAAKASGGGRQRLGGHPKRAQILGPVNCRA